MMTTEPRAAILYAHVQKQNLAYMHTEKKRLKYKTLSSYVDALISGLRIQAMIDNVPHARKKKRLQKNR